MLMTPVLAPLPPPTSPLYMSPQRHPCIARSVRSAAIWASTGTCERTHIPPVDTRRLAFHYGLNTFQFPVGSADRHGTPPPPPTTPRHRQKTASARPVTAVGRLVSIVSVRGETRPPLRGQTITSRSWPMTIVTRPSFSDPRLDSFIATHRFVSRRCGLRRYRSW